MKYFKLFEDWNNLIECDLLTEASTESTTFYHEIISGLSAIGKITEYSQVYNNGKVQLTKFFKDKDIQALDQNLNPISLSEKQNEFLSTSKAPKESMINDAIQSGISIQQRFKKEGIVINKVYWSGPTNDATDFGAADIILSPDENVQKNGVGVSLKYGKGQLKNLSGNQLFQTILPKRGRSGDHNFMDEIWEINKSDIDKMTIEFMDLIGVEINKTKDAKAKSTWKMISKSIKTWDTYQKTTLDKHQGTSLFTPFIPNPISIKELNDFDKVSEYRQLKYFGRKISEVKTFKNKWKPLRTKYFNQFFGNFIKTYESEIADNLSSLLSKQLSVTAKDLWYSAQSGTEIKRIPGQERFDKIAEALDITFTHKESGSGYEVTIHIKTHPDKESGVTKAIEIGSIKIIIRFKQGQMFGRPDTSSSSKWNLKGDEWQTIFT